MNDDDTRPLPAPLFVSTDADGALSLEWFVGDDSIALIVHPSEGLTALRTRKVDGKLTQDCVEGPEAPKAIGTWLT